VHYGFEPRLPQLIGAKSSPLQVIKATKESQGMLQVTAGNGGDRQKLRQLGQQVGRPSHKHTVATSGKLSAGLGRLAMDRRRDHDPGDRP
jgi:hypothetical protein